jgi:hypothetical protein
VLHSLARLRAGTLGAAFGGWVDNVRHWTRKRSLLQKAAAHWAHRAAAMALYTWFVRTPLSQQRRAVEYQSV